MLGTLSDRGLVNYKKYEYIELTSAGADVGCEMRRRHNILREFLINILKIESKIADEEACKMEHTLSSESLSSFTDFMEFIQACPRAGESWLNHFEEYRRHGQRPENCLERTEQFSLNFKQQVDSMKNEDSKKWDCLETGANYFFIVYEE